MQFKDHNDFRMSSPFFCTYADRYEYDFEETEGLISVSPLDGDEIYRAFMPSRENNVPTDSADETRDLTGSQFVSLVPPNQTSIDSYFVSNRNTFTAAVTVRNDDFLAQEHSIQINIRTKTKKPDTNLRAKEQPKTHRYLTRARQKELDQSNSIISNISTPAALTPQRKRSESHEKIHENSNEGKRQRKPGDSPETRDVKKNAVADITRGMTKMARKGKIPEFKKICKDLGMKKKDVLKDLKKQFVGCKSYIKLSKILPKKKSESEPGTGEYTMKKATRDLCDAFFTKPYDEYFGKHYRHGGKVGEYEKKDLTSEEHKQRETKRKEIFLRLKEEFKENFEDPNKKAREGKTEERILKTKDLSK